MYGIELLLNACIYITWLIRLSGCIKLSEITISTVTNITHQGTIINIGIAPVREREIKFIGLFGDRGHRGPYSPYKPCNHNLYIGISTFPHIDNSQSTGYN